MTHEARTQSPHPTGPGGVRRLNWGCGNWAMPGWINSDIKAEPGIQIVGDIRDGLPLETGSLDYAVSIHSLPELHLAELVPALEELRRVLKPGGVLRLALPDLDKGIAAYQRNEHEYFKVSDEDARSIGAKFITQMLWFGYSRSLFTRESIEELLQKARFTRIDHCAYKQTAGPYPEIIELDNREAESLFVEAVK